MPYMVEKGQLITLFGIITRTLPTYRALLLGIIDLIDALFVLFTAEHTE